MGRDPEICQMCHEAFADKVQNQSRAGQEAVGENEPEEIAGDDQ